MNRNFFVNPYVKLNIGENPTRFLKIPINIDNQSITEYIKIKITALFNNLIASSTYSIKLVYLASSDTITATIYKENGTDKRIVINGIVKDNMLYLYFINNGLNSQSFVFAQIVSSSTKNYLFENVVEEIPSGYQTITPTEASISKGQNVSSISTDYPIANVLKSDSFSINCVITLEAVKLENTILFTGVSGYQGNGIAIDISTGDIVLLKTNNNNIVNLSRMEIGSYLVLMNGNSNNIIRES